MQAARGTTLRRPGGDRAPPGVGDESGKADPHVWLDPVRFARIVERIGAVLGRPAGGRALAARVGVSTRTTAAGWRTARGASS